MLMVAQLVNRATAVCAVSADYLDMYNAQGSVFHLGIGGDQRKFGVGDDFKKVPGSRVLLYMGGSSSAPFIKKLINNWHQAAEDYHLVITGSAEWIKKLQSSPEKRLWVYPGSVPGNHLLAQVDIGLVTPDLRLYTRIPFKVYGHLKMGHAILSNIQSGELERWINDQSLGHTFDSSLHGFWDALSRIDSSPQRQNAIMHWAQQHLAVEDIYAQYAEHALSMIKLRDKRA